MEAGSKLRFVKEDPWIAKTLRQYRPAKVLPADLHEWFWDWIEDVGTMMRSREMMVSYVASLIYSLLELGILGALTTLFPDTIISKLIERKAFLLRGR